MIIKYISQNEFANEMEIAEAPFSYRGLLKLWEHLTKKSIDTGADFVLDPIALTTEYKEYTSQYELLKDYPLERVCNIIAYYDGKYLIEVI